MAHDAEIKAVLRAYQKASTRFSASTGPGATSAAPC